MFTKSIEWGLVDDHPMTNKKVQKFSLPHRRVMPIESELVAFADTLPRKWQLYVSLKLWTGRRKGELLPLTRFDLTDRGIRFVNNKRADDVFLLSWEPQTRAIVAELLQIPGNRSPYLFATRRGACYMKEDGTASGFDTMWQRYMTQALAAGKVTRRFTEHDLRKVRASDLSPEQAQHLLRHTSARQTRAYQVNPTVVALK
jgi:integrase